MSFSYGKPTMVSSCPDYWRTWLKSSCFPAKMAVILCVRECKSTASCKAFLDDSLMTSRLFLDYFLIIPGLFLDCSWIIPI